MTKRTRQEILNVNTYASEIARSETYLTNMPRIDPGKPESREIFMNGRSRAIKLGAAAVADTYPTHNLEHYQFKLLSQLEDFYDSRVGIDHFNGHYADTDEYINWQEVDANDKLTYKYYKAKIREFNDTLKETINTAGSRMTFNDLLGFIVTAGTEIDHAKINPSILQHMTREVLVGMRNEVAYEQVLIAADIPYENGTPDDDALGRDFIIYDEGYDLKTSQHGVEKGRDSKLAHGRNPYHVVGGYFNFGEFNGALTLPLEVVDSKVNAVRSDIYAASQWSPQSRAASH